MSFKELNILILGRDNDSTNTFFNSLLVLHEYIESTPICDVKVVAHCTSEYNTSLAMAYSTAINNILYDTESVKDFACTNNIDIIVDQDNIFSLEYGNDNFYNFEVLKTIGDAANSIESFLLGNGIVWLFGNITWNMPLHMRYYDRQGICKDVFNFMMQCTESHSYSVDQQERVRYLANKISQVEYAKDTINYYIMRIRFAERNGFTQQGFHIELNYHLGNYYFLIAGILDSTARLLNDVLHLNITNYKELGLEKEAFIKANRVKRTGFVRILKNRDFNNWVSFLKKRRNFIAHDGDMRQSPLVEENSVRLTDEEVEALIDARQDWSFARSVSGDELVETLRIQVAQFIRLEYDYTVIARDVMLVPDNGNTKIFHPLRSIEYDYTELCKVMNKILKRLKL